MLRQRAGLPVTTTPDLVITCKISLCLVNRDLSTCPSTPATHWGFLDNPGLGVPSNSYEKDNVWLRWDWSLGPCNWSCWIIWLPERILQKSKEGAQGRQTFCTPLFVGPFYSLACSHPWEAAIVPGHRAFLTLGAGWGGWQRKVSGHIYQDTFH